MSTTITQAFIDDFDSNVHYLGQQVVSRLYGKWYDRTGMANAFKFDTLAPAEMAAKTGRHGATPIEDIVHGARWANMEVWDWGEAVDPDDDAQVIIDPQSKYVRSAGFAWGRRIDDTAIAALGGTAVTGADKAGTQTLPVGQKIGASATAADKLTVDLLRQAKAKLDAAEVFGDRVFVHSAKGLQDLLEDPEVTSSDYNSVRALVNGEIGSYLGFDFVRSERLPLNTNSRLNYAYAKPCLGFASAQKEFTRVGEDASNRFMTRIFKTTTVGAVRVEDEGVVEIEIYE